MHLYKSISLFLVFVALVSGNTDFFQAKPLSSAENTTMITASAMASANDTASNTTISNTTISKIKPSNTTVSNITVSSTTVFNNTVSNTTILIVPGAFHEQSHMIFFQTALEQRGYPTDSMTLPSVGNNHTGLDSDVTSIGSTLLSRYVIDGGKNVVLYLHSYAGYPGTIAVQKALSKQQRLAENKTGGIVGIICQSCFLPEVNKSLVSTIPPLLPRWATIDSTNNFINVSTPTPYFFNDVPKPLASIATSQFRNQSLSSFADLPPAPYYAAPEFEGRRTYVYTTLDMINPLDSQVPNVNRTGVAWGNLTIESGHAPFLSQVQTLTDGVIGALEGFWGTY